MPDVTLSSDMDAFLITADNAAARAALGVQPTASPTFTGSVGITGGTVTTSAPVINATQTWNDGGVTFTGIKADVTSTASAAGSLLLDLKLGGVSNFQVTKSGRIVFAPSTNGDYIDPNSSYGYPVFWAATQSIFAYSSSGISIGLNKNIKFLENGAESSAVGDTGLLRRDVGVLALTNASTGGGILEQTQVAGGGTPSSNSARIYVLDNAGTASYYTKNEAGTETIISPHAGDAPEWLYDEDDFGQDNVSRERQFYTGMVRFVNHSRRVRLAGMTPEELAALPEQKRQCLFVETFAEHVARRNLTDHDFVVHDWDQDQMVKFNKRNEEIALYELQELQMSQNRPGAGSNSSASLGDKPTPLTLKPNPFKKIKNKD
jgi:hypothetical protein